MLIFLIVLYVCAKKVNLPLLRNFEVDQTFDDFKDSKKFDHHQFFDENPFKDKKFYEVDSTNGGFMYSLFFESKDGNKDAPVVMWLQGGPGCSSLTGLFAELGPYKVNSDTLQLEENEYSWNDHFHLLFVDNPVGSGYSYVNKEAGFVTTETEVADNLYSLLLQFFADHPQYSSNSFYIFGESYAGKYIPAISAKIMNEGFKIPLKGCGIGDGLTHPVEQFNVYDIFAYANSLVSRDGLTNLIKYQNETVEAIKREEWGTAFSLWNQASSIVDTESGGVNEYDIRTHEQYDFSYITKYINLDSTKELMGIPKERVFSQCNSSVYMYLENDICQSNRKDIIDLINSGSVDVLLYNAQFDLIISVIGSIDGWVYNMPWKYQKEFQQAERKLWKLSDGTFAGWLKSYDHLFSAIVGDAGHLSPMNEPTRLLDLVTKFVNKQL